MTKGQPITNESVKTEREELREQHLAQTPIDHILQKLFRMELPAKEYFERYMRHKWRLNHKPNSLRNSLKAIELFLTFYNSLGKSRLEEIVREDLEAFVVSEQGQGTKITSTIFRYLYAAFCMTYYFSSCICSIVAISFSMSKYPFTLRNPFSQ